MLLDWIGIALCAVAIGSLLYNTYWGLQSLMCPTHLGLAFATMFLPASTWDDQQACSVRTWIRVRAHLRRQLVAAGAILVLLYLWTVGLGTVSTLVITVILTVGVVADARVLALLRNDPDELENYSRARQEMDRELGLGKITGAS